MRSILSVVAIVIAGAIFFVYTKPTFDTIQSTQAQIAQYNAALDKATQLQELKQTLLSRYNSFSPSDLARLETMLPDQVNNIGLILDLDTLANQFGLSLENVNISSPDASGAGSVGAVGASTLPYDSLDVQFTVHGTYAQFIQYITNLETSLRIVDLVGLSIGGGASGSGTGSGSTAPVVTGPAGTDNIDYTFNITLQTYWLNPSS